MTRSWTNPVRTPADGTARSRRCASKGAVLPLLITLLAAFATRSAIASTAFGDLNNFDVFNDTTVNCHGFEIELDDIHSSDITYTYDWNHYGPPTITEDNSDPLHPKVFVRYAAKYDPVTSSFSAFTSVPSTTPSPTDGHQCTNPAVNIGCEHFGVGHYGAPTTIRYNWLIENPSAPGTLIHGPAVNVATPSWTYYPVGPAQPVAQVQAVILAPPPPPAPVYEFGDAVWVKAIVTTTHNNQVVELTDLVSDDPNDPSDKNWANEEPAEVEVEWQILQTEFNNPAGVNNELAGANEDLPNGDEVITRRYEFYKYAGPLDPETNEAKCSKYPQVSDTTSPEYKAECDPATVTVLGDYIGAQMAGFNVEAVLGMIDHIQDGDVSQLYPTRTVVVGGNTPYVTSVTVGTLPDGLNLDSATGVLSGTPTAAGQFSFTITATDADTVQVTKAYTMTINGGVDGCPDDPAKTEPGICGCGVSDTDGDGDGTPDCSDQCVADPAKTAPGACGCGVADTDSDGDGTPDCNDQCVADPAKTAPGACGCGVADVDSNGNGTADCLEPQADVGLGIVPSAASVSVKKKVTYSLVVTNNGPGLADAVVVTATLSGVPLKGAHLAKGCTASGGGTIVCAIGNLAASATATKKITATPAGTGTLSVSATVSSATLDPNTANQNASVDTAVN
jgi:hypothetical protein